MIKPNWNELHSLAKSFNGKSPLNARDLRWISYRTLPNAFYHPHKNLYSLTPDTCSLTLKDQLEDLKNNFKITTTSSLQSYYEVVFTLLKNYLNSPEIISIGKTEDFNRYLSRGKVAA